MSSDPGTRELVATAAPTFDTRIKHADMTKKIRIIRPFGLL